MELYAVEMGEGGRPIVLLHGFGGSAAAWRSLQPRLARSARTLAYDLPGHGRSREWPDAGPARTAVAAVLGDLSGRGIESAHLVGHSMGGAIAAMAALVEPRRVASLTLLAPGGFGAQINARLLRYFAAAREPEAIRIALENMYGWSSDVSEDEVNTLAAERAEAGATETLVEMVGHITRGGRQGEIPRERLAGLAMPVSVLWGELDNVLPVRQTRDLPGRFALHLLPDRGHMLIAEAPETVAAVVERNLTHA